MPNKGLRLVVGLGNPGNAYQYTRHNAGFIVIDEIAGFYSIHMGKRGQLPGMISGRGWVEDQAAILAKPQMYMNRSGPPVRQLADYYKISSEEMLVIHDDIDLAFGRLKIKEKGGHGGHKGLKSIVEAFGGGNFTRLRIGIGRGIENHRDDKQVTDHVLGPFNKEEKMILNQIVSNARDAVVTVLCEGTTQGMNRFNIKRNMV